MTDEELMKRAKKRVDMKMGFCVQLFVLEAEVEKLKGRR